MSILPKDYKDLQYWGIQYFRIKAGFVPQNAPIEECSKVDFEIRDSLKYVNTYSNWETYVSSYKDDDCIGEIIGFEIIAKLCYECVLALSNYYDNETIDVYSNLGQDECCHSCGNFGRYQNDIPF